jgi:hypothetical protein
VIFYNSDLGMIKPGGVQRQGALLQKSGAMFTTNIPDAACARFIGWYLARPEAGEFHLCKRIVPLQGTLNPSPPPLSPDYRGEGRTSAPIPAGESHALNTNLTLFSLAGLQPRARRKPSAEKCVRRRGIRESFLHQHKAALV